MVYSLTGEVTAKKPDRIRLAAGGIEWELAVTATSLNRLPPVGTGTRVFTYLQHRDDGMTLFGFADEKERSVFLDLIKVNGVGPKAALKILSGIPVRDFVAALEGEDVDALSRIPGLGKKTAQKIILALRDSLSLDSAGGSGETDQEAPENISRREIVASLREMGFDRKKAEEAVKRVALTDEILGLPSADRESEIMRRVIVELSR